MPGRIPDERSADRISRSVLYTERQSRGGERFPDNPRNPLPHPLTLYEIVDPPELDEELMVYKCTGWPCYMQWCQVDGDGHWYAAVPEGTTDAVRRWRRDETEDPVDLYFFTGEMDENQEAVAPPLWIGPGRRVWCSTKCGKRVVLYGEPEGIIRCRFTEALYDCQEAQAVVLRADSPEELPCEEKETITVTSPMGLVAACMLAEPGENDELCIPADMVAYVKRFNDTEKYEVLAFGSNPCCCQESDSSSGSSESSQSSESSDSSQSSESQSSQSSGSQSGSSQSPSASQPSGSETPSVSQPSGSDKSSAIVPASWSKSGFTALFIEESPEVRFDDVMTADVREAETRLPIDPRYIEVCEPDSVQVCGCVPDQPAPIGAAVEAGEVVIRLAKKSKKLIRVVIRLTGIRKGFAGHRFPDRTRRQFLANERFIKSAYPGS